MLSIPAAVIIGFVAGVLVNLLADYLPVRHYHHRASADPFISRRAIPPVPPFIPRRADGRTWPVPLWSGVIAALMRAPVYQTHRVRHVVVEPGLAAAFGWITSVYGDNRHLPFFLFYAAVFVLIAVIDVEYRWILFETIWPPALVALAEAAFWPHIGLEESIRGGLYGFITMYALYLLGLVFARVVSVLTGRRIGRTVLGFGDVWMGTLSGLILGWEMLGPALLVMILTGAIAALSLIVYKTIRARRYRAFAAIPYGPYIVLGTAATLYIPSVVGDFVAWIVTRL